MENYGWSIELNPGYVLIIGNAHDAHIQLDSAYGRAVRVGLQVKDDISCAMLSEYSSSYKLSDIGQENVSYDLDPDEFIQKIIMIEVLLEEKYKRLIHQENPEKEITLIIINSQEVYTAISDSKDALNALKNIMGKYKVLNVYLLFGAVPNAQIAYGSPDIYKMMKETKSILFFDNLDNCKIVDIPLAIKRKNQKKIEPGDAYYIFEDEVSKVRIPLVSD